MHFIFHQIIKSTPHAFFKLLEKTLLWREGNKRGKEDEGEAESSQSSSLFSLTPEHSGGHTLYCVNLDKFFFSFSYFSSLAVKWGSWWNSLHDGPFFSIVI